MIGGASAAGRMGVYCESPIAGGDLKSGMPNAPAGLSWDGGALLVAHNGLFYSQYAL